MYVRFVELEDVPVEKMVVDECEDHHAGEVIGYRCQHCGCSDETLGQIWHEGDCPLIGEHGRQHYDDLDRDVEAGPTPEFDPENPIWVVRAAEADVQDGVYKDDVVAFRCQCGNADEDLLEIVHDESCALADEDCDLGRTDVDLIQSTRAIADGGAAK